MPQSGQQMLEESIDACRRAADGLGARNAAWETSVVEIADKFGEVSGTFFFQTMPRCRPPEPPCGTPPPS